MHIFSLDTIKELLSRRDGSVNQSTDSADPRYRAPATAWPLLFTAESRRLVTIFINLLSHVYLQLYQSIHIYIHPIRTDRKRTTYTSHTTPTSTDPPIASPNLLPLQAFYTKQP